MVMKYYDQLCPLVLGVNGPERCLVINFITICQHQSSIIANIRDWKTNVHMTTHIRTLPTHRSTQAMYFDRHSQQSKTLEMLLKRHFDCNNNSFLEAIRAREATTHITPRVYSTVVDTYVFQLSHSDILSST